MENNTLYTLKTVLKETIKDLFRYPEEKITYLHPGNQTPEDLVTADVPPPTTFLSEDD